MPRLVKPLAPLLFWMTAGYIGYHRKRLVGKSNPISENVRAHLRVFFSDAVLA